MYEDVGVLCHGGTQVAEFSRGYETWRCGSRADSALDVDLELAGRLWDDDVVYSRLFIHDPDKNSPVAAVHTALFLQLALPRWPDSLGWVEANMSDAMDGRPRQVIQGESVLTIMWADGSTFVIQVRSR